MTESEWRTFRKLQEVGLERFCERILREIQDVSTNSSKKFHERYLEIYRLVRERDKEVGWAFNDARRSNALQKLAALCVLRLVSPEELARFAQDTQAGVQTLVDLQK
ncbi:MAG: peptide ABC transporter substrate-binding protein [Acidobacteria bacterium]|nr:MAG: peptide ABC transporter substrate-binding protein [Acidobacteriota bacterium]